MQERGIAIDPRQSRGFVPFEAPQAQGISSAGVPMRGLENDTIVHSSNGNSKSQGLHYFYFFYVVYIIDRIHQFEEGISMFESFRGKPSSSYALMERSAG